MLDLSYLGGGRGQVGAEAPLAAIPAQAPAPLSPLPPGGRGRGLDLDDDYARYLTGLHARNPAAVPMSAADFERYSLGAGWLAGLRDVTKKVVQTCRLMIGIHDYEYYLDHMRARHPQATPLSREAFYRYCLEARFPGAQGGVSRCPC
jgi:uncharacterized short protein YbdD (DUF466 family)